MSAPTVLAAEDLAALQLAGEWWHNAAAKEQAIRDRFGITPTRFYQRVTRLIDDPAAQAAEPLIVARLRRLRAQRTRMRGHRVTAGTTR